LKPDSAHVAAQTDSADEALMVHLCQGRDSALAELVRRYQNDIFRFCLHYLKEVDAARDMAQQTFVRVYTARDRFDAARRFRPWLLCIARNLCLNELKRKKTVSMETLEEYASAARDEGRGGEVLRFSGAVSCWPRRLILLTKNHAKSWFCGSSNVCRREKSPKSSGVQRALSGQDCTGCSAVFERTTRHARMSCETGCM